MTFNVYWLHHKEWKSRILHAQALVAFLSLFVHFYGCLAWYLYMRRTHAKGNVWVCDTAKYGQKNNNKKTRFFLLHGHGNSACFCLVQAMNIEGGWWFFVDNVCVYIFCAAKKKTLWTKMHVNLLWVTFLSFSHTQENKIILWVERLSFFLTDDRWKKKPNILWDEQSMDQRTLDDST